MLRAFSWLQVVYLAVGLSTMGTALWLWRGRQAAVRSHRAASGRAPQLAPAANAAGFSVPNTAS